MLSLRILTVDSYQCSPVKEYDVCYSDFRGCEIHKVPVIRVVGNTPAGQKGCLHVHGVFPYLSVRWKDVFPGIEINSSREYTQKLALEIDKALNVEERKTTSNPQHVYNIEVVQRRCMYGYHEEMEKFLKIYFYNPVDVSRTANNLTSCKILNKFIQPHEAHIPFILQFFIDYNLFGMNFLKTSSFKFRASDENFIAVTSPLKNPDISHDDESDIANKVWDVRSFSSSQINGLERDTVCELEADCCGSDILNKTENTASQNNPGLKSIWMEEKLRRKANNEESQISFEESQDRGQIQTDNEILYERLENILKQFKENDKVEEKEDDSSFIGSSCEATNRSLTEMFGLNNTNDRQLLQACMDLAESQSDFPENDSILGTQKEVCREGDDAEEIEMSQRDEFNFLSSITSYQAPDKEILSNQDSISFQQLDGTHDDEDSTSLVPQLSKEASPVFQTDSNIDEEPPILLPEDDISIIPKGIFNNSPIKCAENNEKNSQDVIDVNSCTKTYDEDVKCDTVFEIKQSSEINESLFQKKENLLAEESSRRIIDLKIEENIKSLIDKEQNILMKETCFEKNNFSDTVEETYNKKENYHEKDKKEYTKKKMLLDKKIKSSNKSNKSINRKEKAPSRNEKVLDKNEKVPDKSEKIPDKNEKIPDKNEKITAKMEMPLDKEEKSDKKGKSSSEKGKSEKRKTFFKRRKSSSGKEKYEKKESSSDKKETSLDKQGKSSSEKEKLVAKTEKYSDKKGKTFDKKEMPFGKKEKKQKEYEKKEKASCGKRDPDKQKTISEKKDLQHKQDYQKSEKEPLKIEIKPGKMNNNVVEVENSEKDKIFKKVKDFYQKETTLEKKEKNSKRKAKGLEKKEKVCDNKRLIEKKDCDKGYFNTKIENLDKEERSLEKKSLETNNRKSEHNSEKSNKKDKSFEQNMKLPTLIENSISCDDKQFKSEEKPLKLKEKSSEKKMLISESKQKKSTKDKNAYTLKNNLLSSLKQSLKEKASVNIIFNSDDQNNIVLTTDNKLSSEHHKNMINFDNTNFEETNCSSVSPENEKLKQGNQSKIIDEEVENEFSLVNKFSKKGGQSISAKKSLLKPCRVKLIRNESLDNFVKTKPEVFQIQNSLLDINSTLSSEVKFETDKECTHKSKPNYMFNRTICRTSNIKPNLKNSDIYPSYYESSTSDMPSFASKEENESLELSEGNNHRQEQLIDSYIIPICEIKQEPYSPEYDADSCNKIYTEIGSTRNATENLESNNIYDDYLFDFCESNMSAKSNESNLNLQDDPEILETVPVMNTPINENKRKPYAPDSSSDNLFFAGKMGNEYVRLEKLTEADILNFNCKPPEDLKSSLNKNVSVNYSENIHSLLKSKNKCLNPEKLKKIEDKKGKKKNVNSRYIDPTKKNSDTFDCSNKSSDTSTSKSLTYQQGIVSMVNTAMDAGYANEDHNLIISEFTSSPDNISCNTVNKNQDSSLNSLRKTKPPKSISLKRKKRSSLYDINNSSNFHLETDISSKEDQSNVLSDSCGPLQISVINYDQGCLPESEKIHPSGAICPKNFIDLMTTVQKDLTSQIKCEETESIPYVTLECVNENLKEIPKYFSDSKDISISDQVISDRIRNISTGFSVLPNNKELQTQTINIQGDVTTPVIKSTSLKRNKSKTILKDTVISDQVTSDRINPSSSDFPVFPNDKELPTLTNDNQDVGATPVVKCISFKRNKSKTDSKDTSISDQVNLNSLKNPSSRDLTSLSNDKELPISSTNIQDVSTVVLKSLSFKRNKSTTKLKDKLISDQVKLDKIKNPSCSDFHALPTDTESPTPMINIQDDVATPVVKSSKKNYSKTYSKNTDRVKGDQNKNPSSNFSTFLNNKKLPMTAFNSDNGVATPVVKSLSLKRNKSKTQSTDKSFSDQVKSDSDKVRNPSSDYSALPNDKELPSPTINIQDGVTSPGVKSLSLKRNKTKPDSKESISNRARLDSIRNLPAGELPALSNDKELSTPTINIQDEVTTPVIKSLSLKRNKTKPNSKESISNRAKFDTIRNLSADELPALSNDKELSTPTINILDDVTNPVIKSLSLKRNKNKIDLKDTLISDQMKSDKINSSSSDSQILQNNKKSSAATINIQNDVTTPVVKSLSLKRAKSKTYTKDTSTSDQMKSDKLRNPLSDLSALPNDKELSTPTIKIQEDVTISSEKPLSLKRNKAKPDLIYTSISKQVKSDNIKNPFRDFPALPNYKELPTPTNNTQDDNTTPVVKSLSLKRNKSKVHKSAITSFDKPLDSFEKTNLSLNTSIEIDEDKYAVYSDLSGAIKENLNLTMKTPILKLHKLSRSELLKYNVNTGLESEKCNSSKDASMVNKLSLSTFNNSETFFKQSHEEIINKKVDNIHISKEANFVRLDMKDDCSSKNVIINESCLLNEGNFQKKRNIDNQLFTSKIANLQDSSNVHSESLVCTSNLRTPTTDFEINGNQSSASAMNILKNKKLENEIQNFVTHSNLPSGILASNEKYSKQIITTVETNVKESEKINLEKAILSESSAESSLLVDEDISTSNYHCTEKVESVINEKNNYVQKISNTHGVHHSSKPVSKDTILSSSMSDLNKVNKLKPNGTQELLANLNDNKIRKESFNPLGSNNSIENLSFTENSASNKSNKFVNSRLSLKLNKRENCISKAKVDQQHNSKKKWRVDRRLFGENKFAVKGRSKERVAEIVSDSRLRIKLDTTESSTSFVSTSKPRFLSRGKQMALFKNSFQKSSDSALVKRTDESSFKCKKEKKVTPLKKVNKRSCSIEQPCLSVKLNQEQDSKNQSNCLVVANASKSCTLNNTPNTVNANSDEEKPKYITRHPRKCKEKAMQNVKNQSTSDLLDKSSSTTSDPYNSDDSVTIIKTVKVEKKPRKTRLKVNNISVPSSDEVLSGSAEFGKTLSPNSIPKLKISLKWMTTENNEVLPIVIDKKLQNLNNDSDDSIQEIFSYEPNKDKNKSSKRKRFSSFSESVKKSDLSIDLQSKNSDKKQCVAPLKINLINSAKTSEGVEKIKTLTLKKNPCTSNFCEYVIKKEILSDDEIDNQESTEKVEHLVKPTKRRRGRPKKTRQVGLPTPVEKTASPTGDLSPLKNQSSFCIDHSSPGDKIRIVKKPPDKVYSKIENFLPENSYDSHVQKTVPPLQIVNGVVIKQEIESDDESQNYDEPIQYHNTQYSNIEQHPQLLNYNRYVHNEDYNEAAQQQSYNAIPLDNSDQQICSQPVKIPKKRGRKPGKTNRKNSLEPQARNKIDDGLSIVSEKISSFIPANRIITRRQSLRPRGDVKYFPTDQNSDEEKNESRKSPKKRLRKHSAPGKISANFVQDNNMAHENIRRSQVQDLIASCNSFTINIKKLSTNDISSVNTYEDAINPPKQNAHYESFSTRDSDIEIISDTREENNKGYFSSELHHQNRITNTAPSTVSTTYNSYLNYGSHSTNSHTLSTNFANIDTVSNYYNTMPDVPTSAKSFTNTNSNNSQHDDLLSSWNMPSAYDEEPLKRQVPSPIDLNSDVLNSGYFSPINYNIQETSLDQRNVNNFSRTQPHSNYTGVNYNYGVNNSRSGYNYNPDPVPNPSKPFNNLHNQHIENSASSHSMSIMNSVNSPVFEEQNSVQHYNPCNISTNISGIEPTCIKDLSKSDINFDLNKKTLPEMPLDMDYSSSKICNVPDYNLSNSSPYSQVLRNLEEPNRAITPESSPFDTKDYRLSTPPTVSTLTVPTIDNRSRDIPEYSLRNKSISNSSITEYSLLNKSISNNSITEYPLLNKSIHNNTLDSSQDDSSYDIPSEKMDISPASDAFLMDAHAFSDNQSSPNENKNVENVPTPLGNDENMDFLTNETQINKNCKNLSNKTETSLSNIDSKNSFELRTFDLSEGMIESDPELHSLGNISLNTIEENLSDFNKDLVDKYTYDPHSHNEDNTLDCIPPVPIPDPVVSNASSYFEELDIKQDSVYQVSNERIIQNNYITPVSNEGFSSLNSNSESTIINPTNLYEIPYNCGMIQVPTLCEPVAENMFYATNPPVNRSNINYVPTVMVAEPTAHQVSFLYNNTSIVVGGNQVQEPESVNYLQTNELVQSCSVSSTSDTDTQSNSQSTLQSHHHEKLDILSVAVKECDIGEEFDPDNELMEDDKLIHAVDDNFSRKESLYFKMNVPNCNSPDTNCPNQDLRKSVPYLRDTQKDFLGRTQHNFSPQFKTIEDSQIARKHPNDFGVMETAVPSPQEKNVVHKGQNSSVPKSVLQQILLQPTPKSSHSPSSQSFCSPELSYEDEFSSKHNYDVITETNFCKLEKGKSLQLKKNVSFKTETVLSFKNASNTADFMSNCIPSLNKSLLYIKSLSKVRKSLGNLTNQKLCFQDSCVNIRSIKELSNIDIKLLVNSKFNKNQHDTENSYFLNSEIQSFYDDGPTYGFESCGTSKNTSIFHPSNAVNISSYMVTDILNSSDSKENTQLSKHIRKSKLPSAMKSNKIQTKHKNKIVYSPLNKPPKSTEVKKWSENKFSENDHLFEIKDFLDQSSEDSDCSSSAIQNNSTSEPSNLSLFSHKCIKKGFQELKLVSPKAKTVVHNIENDIPRLKINCLPQPLSLENLESTPVFRNLQKRNFLSLDIGVSPINKKSFLTRDTKPRKCLFSDLQFSSQKSLKLMQSKTPYTQQGKYNENSLIWMDSNQTLSSEIEGPTLENSKGFKVNSRNLGLGREMHEVQHLTLMSLEIHVNTRNCFRPDPRFDSVTALFYSIYTDAGTDEHQVVGIICIHSGINADNKHFDNELMHYLTTASKTEKCKVTHVTNEISLFKELTAVVREWDPDILIGYEIQMASWGFLNSRAASLNINLTSLLSRFSQKKTFKEQKIEFDHTVVDQTADVDNLRFPGRILLNVWRLMRNEINLNVYTFENVYYHACHRRTPMYTFQDLTEWYQSVKKEKVIVYYVTRVIGSVQFLEKFDLIRRTSELARLFGIQFYEVLSRGSQYRVESMMLRTAIPFFYSPVSPSPQQRAHSRAPECLPLTLEPESNFYTDPVVVLDFQSLYPSMIIAYNYCFSTCLGRMEHFGKNVPFEFGCTNLTVPSALLLKLQKANNIHISPTGIAFVKASVRRGVLPMMLEEILNTRIMVKRSLKKNKHNAVLNKLLDARQLGLKLIANVTYGYTAANFSGRMPCVEVADSVVGKGRETLERAIRLIENTPRWKAKVVYGDTDSLFILLPGRSKEEAFVIGQEMADIITSKNPRPVKLKFEKVYLPCVLQTKKRYVGFMYENVDQSKPTFDAKGIETIRRDTCAAASKILEKSLKILFETSNVSIVKKYVQKQFSRILKERVNLADFIFAKEYRGINGYRPGACVPALEIAKKRLSKDPRSEPRVGERVPYVIVYGFPGMPIIKLVREPLELIMDKNLRINTTYYITRVISPPLERVFNLLKTDVKIWYTDIAHKITFNLPMLHEHHHQKGTLTQYYKTQNCPCCSKITSSHMCEDCCKDSQGTFVTLTEKIRSWERAVSQISHVCAACTKSFSSNYKCISVDCPVLFKFNLAKRDLSQAPYLRGLINQELF